jgi:hypothetical protein
VRTPPATITTIANAKVKTPSILAFLIFRKRSSQTAEEEAQEEE